MAYQSKHTGINIDNNIDQIPDLQTQINNLNSLINSLNNSISIVNTNITNLQSKDTDLQTSINTINSVNDTQNNRLTSLEARVQMPNYSSVITSKTGTSGAWSYTATKNCYVYFTVSANSSTTYCMKINDIAISATNIYGKSGMVLLTAGDKLACSANNNGYSYYVFNIKYV